MIMGSIVCYFFFTFTSTTEIYTYYHPLSLLASLPIFPSSGYDPRLRTLWNLTHRPCRRPPRLQHCGLPGSHSQPWHTPPCPPRHDRSGDGPASALHSCHPWWRRLSALPRHSFPARICIAGHVYPPRLLSFPHPLPMFPTFRAVP